MSGQPYLTLLPSISYWLMITVFDSGGKGLKLAQRNGRNQSFKVVVGELNSGAEEAIFPLVLGGHVVHASRKQEVLVKDERSVGAKVSSVVYTSKIKRFETDDELVAKEVVVETDAAFAANQAKAKRRIPEPFGQ